MRGAFGDARIGKLTPLRCSRLGEAREWLLLVRHVQDRLGEAWGELDAGDPLGALATEGSGAALVVLRGGEMTGRVGRHRDACRVQEAGPVLRERSSIAPIPELADAVGMARCARSWVLGWFWTLLRATPVAVVGECLPRRAFVPTSFGLTV